METLPSINFGKRRVGTDAPVLVIAEVGINHEGDVEVCRRMVEEAVKAGADAVKLQTIDPDRNYAVGTESYRLFKTAVLSREATANVFSQAQMLGAAPFTTVGDFVTLEWVEKLAPAGYKISSGLLTCTPIIARTARTGRPILMSTGLAADNDIDCALSAAQTTGNKKIVLLQCTSLYPSPLDRLNLAKIGELQRRYGVLAGFSDHSIGTDAAPLAAAAGATVIEKHFSLDPSRPSYDHEISLDPRSFRRMVDEIRKAETARGRATTEIGPDLVSKRNAMSRYLAVIAPVAVGEQLGETNVGFLQLADAKDALPASAFEDVRGMRAAKDITPVTALTAAMILS